MRTSNRVGFRHWSRRASASTRTAVYGPVRTVVWQGGGGGRPPPPPPKRRRGGGSPQPVVQTASMANKKHKLTSPKTVLKLPDLEQSKSAVLNSLTSRSSQRSYDHAIREFIDWYCSEPRLAFNKTVVTRYRINLEQAQYASSTINLRLAAIRRLAYEAADCGLLSPYLAAGIRRVKGVKKHGMRIGNWLTADQGKRLLAAFGGEDLPADVTTQ